MMPFFSETIGLIGIDTGHKRLPERVVDKTTRKPIDPDWRVYQNTFVAIVCPVWKIWELLDQEEFMPKRLERDVDWLAKHEHEQASSDEAMTDDEFGSFESLARKIIGVSKDEADEVHRGHES